jgi:hypothetical protein
MSDLPLVIDSGDLKKARAFFDQCFWEGRKIEPDWSHVKLALLTENKPMLRFLANRGAPCTPANLENLRTVVLDKFPHYAALLRQCGLHLSQVKAQTEMRYIYYSPAAEKSGGSLVALARDKNGNDSQVVYTNNSPSLLAEEDYTQDKVLVWSGKASDFRYIGWHCRGTAPQAAPAMKPRGPSL